MYRLIIVDDDEIICNGLNQGIKWEENGIRVVGTAYDGEAALALIKKELPDIVLIDINLPFLDGLELSGILRQEYPEIKIILLTAYSEFEYAKKAVKLQVFDYITKPFDNRKVLEAACNAKESVMKERAVKDKIKEGLPLIKEKYFCKLLTGSIQPERETEIRKFIGLPDESYFGVAILSIRSYYCNSATDTISGITAMIVNNEFMKREIYLAVRELLDDFKVISFNSGENEIVMIFKDFASRGRCEQYMDRTANEVKKRINTIDEYHLTISLGTAVWGFHDIAKSYGEAKMALEHCWHFENHSIIRIGDMDSLQNEIDLNIDAKQKTIIHHIKLGRPAEVSSIVDAIFQALKEAKSLSFSYVQLVAVETVILAYKAIDEEYCESKTACLSNDALPQVISLGNLEEIARWVKNKLVELSGILSEQRRSGAERAIAKAALYIEDNYRNPDLTLNEVAEWIHLSPTYFSALFRQVKNVNFSDYLETLRINKAIELFNTTELKIYEVAYRVGYNSPQYFSICFKKNTGNTPSEFKIDKSR
jgi:two-component system response regulator YesN